MRINKKTLVIIIIVGVTTSVIFPITLFYTYLNFLIPPDVKYSRGFQVSYDEVSPSEPIVILNPKGTNIFYRTQVRYMGTNHDYIFLNYRTAPGVIAQYYILDGGTPQIIPPDNVIPKPAIGNHTLMITGTNSTGYPFNSTTVSFQIGDIVYHVPGVLSNAPECFDYSYSSSVRFAVSKYGVGLITDTLFNQEIFLEGPEKPLSEPEYTRNVDLTIEAIATYAPFLVLRSESWYNHSFEIVNSHWVNLVSGGEIVDRIWVTSGAGFSAREGITKVIYFRTNILHVFGNVTFWNGETRYYDVFDIEGLSYTNTYAVSYGANDTILDNPILGPVDLSQFSGIYQDKNMIENEFWEWKRDENWLKSYGIEASIFLGNYAGVNSCPVPVLFRLPQENIENNEMIPDEITHTFTRTDTEPDNFDANYRGLENVFSMNIISSI